MDEKFFESLSGHRMYDPNLAFGIADFVECSLEFYHQATSYLLDLLKEKFSYVDIRVFESWSDRGMGMMEEAIFTQSYADPNRSLQQSFDSVECSVLLATKFPTSHFPIGRIDIDLMVERDSDGKLLRKKPTKKTVVAIINKFNKYIQKQGGRNCTIFDDYDIEFM